MANRFYTEPYMLAALSKGTVLKLPTWPVMSHEEVGRVLKKMKAARRHG